MRVFLVCGNSNCDILVLLLPLHTLWSKVSSAFSPHFASLCTDLLLLRQRLGDNTGFLIISHSPWHLLFFKLSWESANKICRLNNGSKLQLLMVLLDSWKMQHIFCLPQQFHVMPTTCISASPTLSSLTEACNCNKRIRAYLPTHCPDYYIKLKDEVNWLSQDSGY